MTKFKPLLAIALTIAFTQIPALAYRNLPKAGFPVNTQQGGGGSALPRVNGLHLDEGVDRTPAQSRGPAQPYNPGEQAVHWERVRWENKKMPILIWLSPGIKLPDVPFDQIQSTRVDMVNTMLRTQENPWLGLSQAVGWTPEINDQVAAGIEEWREFEREGLFSFAYTDDPRQAHVLIFFTDSFKDAASPGGINVGGITSAQIYPVAQAQSIKIGQKPVIIELSTMVNSTPERMYGASAHEFGHALGIKAHSPFREDIMFVDRVVTHLSPADKATIRYLYRNTPQWVM
jgi:predicted Zn-dependent protease